MTDTTLPLLEAELKRRARNDTDANDLWQRYNVVKNYLATNYYGWVQAKLPYYTDHGETHIRSVVETASRLLSRLLSDKKRRLELTSLDIFAMLSAIIWHDVGMVLGRSGHERRIGEISEEVKKLAFPNLAVQRLVVEIATAHGGEDGLSGPQTDANFKVGYKSYQVFPKALAAIVRFADEVSEDQTRISEAILPTVPMENRIFWEYANCIVSAVPEPENERVVVTIALDASKVTTKLPPSGFPQRCDASGKMPLITYVLCRLEKMNNERAYCSRWFNKYVSIREIEARFEIIRGTERLKDYELSVTFLDGGLRENGYPSTRIVDEFFSAHPEWTPQRLKKDLKP